MGEASRDTIEMSADADAGPDRDLRGLSAAEVEERRARGESNLLVLPVSRTVGEIVRANVLTRFNLLVGSLVAVILVVGPIQDAVFGVVMVLNSAIGIIQELRAKRSLDRLALVSAPGVAVVRGGRTVVVPPHEVVLGDLMRVGRGDQLVADGEVVVSAGLEVDESLLTGEAEPRPKPLAERCLSGSAVVAGSGLVVATRVGERAYAARVTREARRFEVVASELRADTDRLLRWIGWGIAPTAAILIWSQIRAAGTAAEAARGAVSGTVGMIPQGLVLLISVALAVGVARLARMSVLTQDLGALEGLARVDVICFDKTGTITNGRLFLLDVIPVAPDSTAPTEALAALAHADPDPNATMQAIAAGLAPPPGWRARLVVPFRSDRRWSGVDFFDHGSWLLGAADALCPGDTRIAGMQAEHSAAGHRVLVLATTGVPLGAGLDPSPVEPAAVVVLGDEIRADAIGTIRYFREQGVALKVISGDDPATAAAVARAAGIEGAACSGVDLPESSDALGQAADRVTVFGRMAPDRKRDLVEALRARGHVVAMVGDGVNDVLALKASDVGVAMGTGSPAARAVAPLILVDGRFARMPAIVAEGRRVIGNTERVANLYITKTIYAFFLAWAVGVVGWAFPLLPRHYTVVGVLTVGIPSFWLALEPSRARAHPGFIGRVLRFGIPVGAITAMAGFSSFWVARAEGVPLDEAQTVTTLTLVAVGLAVLLVVARPLTPVRKLIVTVMALFSLVLFAMPGSREFYALHLPRPAIVLSTIGIVSVTAAVMYAMLRVSGWWRELPTAIRDLGVLARPEGGPERTARGRATDL